MSHFIQIRASSKSRWLCLRTECDEEGGWGQGADSRGVTVGLVLAPRWRALEGDAGLALPCSPSKSKNLATGRNLCLSCCH